MSNAKAILTDTTLCTGCEECVTACKKENKLGKDVPRRWKKHIDSLSSTRYCTIVRRPNGKNVRQQCRHCEKPACVSACIVGALKKAPNGAVIYDADRCMGCRYCMMACPYGIPRYDWEKAVPFVRKCTLCYSRLKKGQQPACTEACPEKATIFGSRKKMLSEAHRRIRINPKKYINRVFGEKEVGGTSVLYISDIDLSFLATNPKLTEKPLPELTWAALTKVPPIVIGVGTAMAGLYWFVGRRQRIMAEEKTAAAKAAAKAEQDAALAAKEAADDGEQAAETIEEPSKEEK